MESISSMKMIDGECSLAIMNNSRTILEPSPINFWTSSEPETLYTHFNNVINYYANIGVGCAILNPRFVLENWHFEIQSW